MASQITSHAPRRRNRSFFILGGLLTLALAAGLILDVRSLRWYSSEFSGGSAVGRAAAAYLSGWCYLDRWRPDFEAVVVKNHAIGHAGGHEQTACVDGDLLLIEPDTESWNDAAHALSERPAETLYLKYTPIDEASGLWAVTRTHRKHVVEVSYGSSFSAAERARARTLFLQSIADDRRRVKVKTDVRLTAGDYEETETVWAGYLHNAIAAVLIAAFVWSLRWLPPAICGTANWVTIRRQRSRAARNLCPRCRYPRAGLTTEPCPECGHNPALPQPAKP